jgi:hypothetical protein
MLGAACSFVVSIRAQADVSQEDKAAARALFDEARALAAESRYAEACPRFEESYRLDPGIGTQYNLAACYEQTGRTASAWSLFLQVASAAAGTSQTEREVLARQRAAALEPGLLRILLDVPRQSRVPGLLIRRDGSPLGQESWGVSQPWDPGQHLLSAEAPGYKTWSAKVHVGPEVTSVVIPRLEAEPRAQPVAGPPRASKVGSGITPPAPQQQAQRPGPGALRISGLISAGVGVGSLVAGGVMARQASSAYDDSKTYCAGDLCMDRGLALREEAVTKGNIATGLVSAGGVLVATGIVLYLVAPADRTPARTAVGLGPAGAFVKGAW